MDSLQLSSSFTQNGWTIYLIYFVGLVVLFFIQKYSYKIDKMLNRIGETGSTRIGRPWPLHAGMGLGLFWFLYNTFSKIDLSFDFAIQNAFKVILLVLILVGFVGVIYESITIFGLKTGIIRSIIYIVLMILYFYAGFISGLFLITILVIGIFVFFLKYFKNLLTLK